MILLIDNYDSFTYNLYQLISELGKNVQVVRNDEIAVEEIEKMEPEAIVISPGPGTPDNTGICLELIRNYYHKIPILGICLGHQAVAAAFGAKIKPAKTIKHGKTSLIHHTGQSIFSGFSEPLEVMRYHSLAIDEKTLPSQFEILAKSSDDREIMAIKHKKYPLYGLQFHPESIGTKKGKELLRQFFLETKKERKMKHYLKKLSERHSLNKEEMRSASRELLLDEITDSEVAAFLMGLKAKGETADEVAALVEVLREHALGIKKKIPNVMDNCGTGGDGAQSFNISTTSAFVLAGGGVKVAKHGNRSVSSKTGSADVLEYLGISLDLHEEEVEELLEENHIAFLFAPHVHPRMKKIMKVRRDLKIPTIFNLIGPLTNPVDLDSQLLGIYRRDMLEMMAEVLMRLGRKRAIVLNGAGFMDEASLSGENHLVLLENGHIQKMTVTPEDVDLPYYSNEAIVGGEAKENAEILIGVLKGEKGAYRDTVLLNAGLGFFASGKADTIQGGIQLAKESIDSGRALSALQYLIDYSEKRKRVVI